MIDFSFSDPRLLFPNITEAWASALDFIGSLITIIGFFLTIIAEWRIFKKFGEKAWKSLIPFWDSYIMYKNTWGKAYFWLYTLMSISYRAATAASKYIAQLYPNSPWMTILVLISLPLGIIAVICSILYALRLAEAFGKGKIFAVGLLVLYPIFISILGFGKSRYISPFVEAKTEEANEGTESKVEVV